MKDIFHWVLRDGHWVGNIVVPALAACIAVYYWKRRLIHGSVRAAVIGATISLVVLAAFATYEFTLWKPSDTAWVVITPTTMYVSLSGWPILGPCSEVFGYGNWFQEHFFVPCAVAVWAILGIAVRGLGRLAILTFSKRQTAQPGATDNPDDAR